MLTYIAKRSVIFVVVSLVISLGCFSLIHLLPGDPTAAILGTGNTPENRALLMKQMGLNHSFFVQFWNWLANLLHGNFGEGFTATGRYSIRTTIGQALPIDVEIIVLSQIFAFFFAVPLAMRAARKQGGLFDKIANGASFGLLSIPSFVLIVYLVKLVAEILHIPGTAPGAFSNNFLPGLGQFFSAPGASFAILGRNLMALLIPALTLSVGSFVIYFRVLRSDIIANLQEEFVTMARSKGLSRRRIMWRHVLRPSSVALLSTAGINIGGLLAGGFVVQYVMAIPGLGYAFTNAITNKNFLLIQAIVFVISVSILSITFFIDFITAAIDPRISRD